MIPYVLLYSKGYEAIANIAVESVKAFSNHECHAIELPQTEIDLHEFSHRRMQWIAENVSSFRDGFCLLEADMVATRSIDNIFMNEAKSTYPLFTKHPNQPARDEFVSMVRFKGDVTYMWYVPSIWPQSSSWFAWSSLNTMNDWIGDELSVNLVSWRAHIQNCVPTIAVRSMNPSDKDTGSYYHGEKNPRIASRLFNAIRTT